MKKQAFFSYFSFGFIQLFLIPKFLKQDKTILTDYSVFVWHFGQLEIQLCKFEVNFMNHSSPTTQESTLFSDSFRSVSFSFSGWYLTSWGFFSSLFQRRRDLITNISFCQSSCHPEINMKILDIWPASWSDSTYRTVEICIDRHHVRHLDAHGDSKTGLLRIKNCFFAKQSHAKNTLKASIWLLALTTTRWTVLAL